MKKIIRLTESDLTRIVRRVISEQTTSTKIKVKAFSNPDDLNKGVPRALNLDITNPRIKGVQVIFDYNTPGMEEWNSEWIHSDTNEEYKSIFVKDGIGFFRCGEHKNRIALDNVNIIFTKKINGKPSINTTKDIRTMHDFYLTPQGSQKLERYCSAYASNDNNQTTDNNYA